MAVHVLIEMRNRYCKKGGSLFCGFVDITKAFDRLKYGEIWDRLKKIKCGTNIINMIREQYQNQDKKVMWEGEVSESFKVDMGVRQGSPLSPFLFAIVMDEIVETIKDLNVGCRINERVVNILVYADDIVVMGPTKHAVEKILKVLTRALKEKGLEVNKEKTVAMEFNKASKNWDEGKNIKIEGKEIKWVKNSNFGGLLCRMI
jgi:hypothetical protein